MNMSKRLVFLVLFLLLTLVYGQGHLKYYGFAIVDCGWDDPLDSEVKTNYLSEVDSFTNVNQLCVFNPDDDIRQRVTDMNDSDVRPILHVQEIFYEDIDGTLYLRSDYQSRWNTFTSTNNSVLFPDSVAAFYLIDEPVHNGLSFEDLQTVSDLVKSDYPAIPTLIIEAWPDVDSLHIPLSIDWCGFDKYGVYDPNTDSEYQQLLATLKSKRSDPNQRIVIIMDAQFLPDYYGLGWTPDTMKTVAANYYNLAASDSDVIAMVGYLWPGGLDTPAQLGARELPQTVQDEYVRIGQLIINQDDQSLPVELVSFTAISSDGRITLRWATESELNNAAFLIERGTDERHFTLFGEVHGQGSKNSRTDYTFTDTSVVNSSTYFYRLADRSRSGKITYHSVISATAGVPMQEDEVPGAFALLQNYPNPFNPQTKINYALPKRVHVSLYIYNIMGQRVIELVNGNQSAGVHTIKWNGRDSNGKQAASGIYVYELKVNGSRLTRKMIMTQ